MKIIQNPKNWKDLQNKVAEILIQCNFKVEVERKIKSTRSEIEIDVYAEECIDNRKYLILCECKMWNSNIPQLYIHGLRTVVNDIGANKGYIITTSNFQKGSIDSIQNTNIELLTWMEFQKIFFKSWYINFFSKELISIIKSDYDPTAIQFYDDFTKIKKGEFVILIQKYNSLQVVENHFPCYLLKDFSNEFEAIENKLPLNKKLNMEEWELESLVLPIEIMEETNFTKFLLLVSNFAKPIYTELNKLDLYIE